ncbi:hypothetical protein [Providencia manganoxydans]|uniref:hypothetical protein n=1 Tax=Providencia manganoxydans TaxID=2923283 RepID=UPI0032DAAF89
MSDKKEIAILSIKISVDSTDLDKLEAQLKRIKGLMVSTGLKQQAKQGFTMDIGVFNPKGCLEPVFTVSPGVAYINEACIEKVTLEKAMIQAAKEGAKKGVEQELFKVTTDVNHNDDQLSSMAKLADTERKIEETDAAGILDSVSEAFHNSNNKVVITALSETIDINTPVSREEFLELRRIVESELSQLHSSLADIRASMIRSEAAAIVNCSTGSDGQIECADRLIKIDKQRELINADIDNQQKIVDALLEDRKKLFTAIGYHSRRSWNSSKIPPTKKP